MSGRGKRNLTQSKATDRKGKAKQLVSDDDDEIEEVDDQPQIHPLKAPRVENRTGNPTPNATFKVKQFQPTTEEDKDLTLPTVALTKEDIDFRVDECLFIERIVARKAEPGSIGGRFRIGFFHRNRDNAEIDYEHWEPIRFYIEPHYLPQPPKKFGEDSPGASAEELAKKMFTMQLPLEKTIPEEGEKEVPEDEVVTSQDDMIIYLAERLRNAFADWLLALPEQERVQIFGLELYRNITRETFEMSDFYKNFVAEWASAGNIMNVDLKAKFEAYNGKGNYVIIDRRSKNNPTMLPSPDNIPRDCGIEGTFSVLPGYVMCMADRNGDNRVISGIVAGVTAIQVWSPAQMEALFDKKPIRRFADASQASVEFYRQGDNFKNLRGFFKK